MKESVMVSYSGDVSDTASLVGLANIRYPITQIVYRGSECPAMREYCALLSDWLVNKGLPRISMDLKPMGLSLPSPHRAWGWGKEECVAAIRLSGLPLPPFASVS